MMFSSHAQLFLYRVVSIDMKLTPLFCTALLVLALGGLSSVQAQTSPAAGTPPPAEGHGRMLDFLTPAEKTQYETDREKAIAADPTIKAAQDDLKKDRETAKASGQKATPDERKATMQKRIDLDQKIHAGMIKLDPSVSPVIDKVVAHMKDRMAKHKDGTAAAAPAAGTSSSQ